MKKHAHWFTTNISSKQNWKNAFNSLYTLLSTLKVKVAPKKTDIDKASQGFGFLGKRVLPIGLLPSTAALSRMQKNTERSSFRQKREQGASKKRIVRYWVTSMIAMGAVVTSTGFASPCTSYQSQPFRCSCLTASGLVQAAEYRFDIDGHNSTNISSNIGYCSSNADRECIQPKPIALGEGIHYFRNTTETSDYFSGTVTHGAVGGGCIAAPHTPVVDDDLPPLDPEPTSHPTTGSTEEVTDNKIVTTWQDTGEGASYAIMCSDKTYVAGPADRQPQRFDNDCSDGFGVQTIKLNDTSTASGLESANTLRVEWNGLTPEKQYYFTIYPYNGRGQSVNYKIHDNPLTLSAITLADLPAEPTSHASSGSAQAVGNNQITTSWEDTGEDAAFAVFCNTTNQFTDPEDRVQQVFDNDCSDGAGVQTIKLNDTQGIAAINRESSNTEGVNTLSVDWKGLNSGTTYYFKIIPYSGVNTLAVNYKTDGSPLLLSATTGSTAGTENTNTATNPGVFGGEKVTPTVYKVTVSKVEFKNAQGQYITLAEQGTSYDVASVSANSPVGSFGKTSVLPNGSYSEIRVTLAGNFELSASGSDKGTSCRTDSNGSTGNVSNTLTHVAIGSSDGGAATAQIVNYPSGTSATDALNNAGISQSGNNLLVTAPANFTITDNGLPPSIAIDIDVAGTVEVLTANGNCHILPQPPSVNVKVGG